MISATLPAFTASGLMTITVNSLAGGASGHSCRDKKGEWDFLTLIDRCVPHAFQLLVLAFFSPPLWAQVL